jgi:hypothetical protein
LDSNNNPNIGQQQQQFYSLQAANHNLIQPQQQQQNPQLNGLGYHGGYANIPMQYLPYPPQPISLQCNIL